MNEAQIFSIHTLAGTSFAHRPDFLASLAEQRDHRFQVIVVDGAEKAALDPILSVDVIHVRNFREVSYAKGHNQAMALALQRWPEEQWQERFIVLSRPETVFHPGCLEAFTRAFTNDPSLGIAVPKMLVAEIEMGGEGDTGELRLTSTIYEVGYECRKDRSLYFLDAGREETTVQTPRDVFGGSDPCIVIRASVLAALKEGSEQWLDESLPRGQEIIDLCWRAHQVGVAVKVIPEACIWFVPPEPKASLLGRRRVYLAGPVREKNDWLVLELLHFPWVVVGMFRSGLFLLTHPGEILARIHAWSVWRRHRRPASVQSRPKQVTVAEMRRWFV